MDSNRSICESCMDDMPFNKAAVFSDGTGSYRIPPEPKPYEPVKIRIRTARQKLAQVVMCVEDRKYHRTVGIIFIIYQDFISNKGQ